MVRKFSFIHRYRGLFTIFPLRFGVYNALYSIDFMLCKTWDENTRFYTSFKISCTPIALLLQQLE